MEKTGPKKEVKLDDITVKKLEEAFSMDASISEACLFANISRQTYYNWIKDHEDLKERFDKLREYPVLLARKTVVDKLQESYSNAMDYLKRKRKDEFSERQEVTGKDGGPMELRYEDFSEEQLKNIVNE